MRAKHRRQRRAGGETPAVLARQRIARGIGHRRADRGGIARQGRQVRSRRETHRVGVK